MNQIATKQEQDTLPVVTSDSAALMQVISRAASDPAYDIDKMERLFKMHQEIVARDAEREFNTAMAGVQAKSRRVAADLHNPQTHSNYASYAALDRALRPLYTEAGFALSFGTGDPLPDAVQVICYVTHSAGHTRKYQIPMPADGKGAKGGDVMTKTHATGSATQYGMRYLLKMIFNVAIGIDIDDDGNGSEKAERISADQCIVLGDLLVETKKDKSKFLEWFGLESLEDMPVKRYAEAMRMLNDRKKKIEEKAGK